MTTPLRGTGDEQGPSIGTSPRRAAIEDVANNQIANGGPWLKRPTLWMAIAALALVGVLALAVFRPSLDAQPGIPSIGSSTTQGETSTISPSTTQSGNAPARQTPSDQAPPLPGTVSPTPVAPAPPEPSPAGSATAGLVELNDAQFTAPEGWTIYGDEVIENDRRAIRLSNPATDARLQAVTLEGGTAKLTDSCVSLVDLQQAQFEEVTRQLVVPIGVDTTAGTGVRCGFTGVRSSDGVANTVTFTLVTRTSDSHVLMLRTTIPDTVPSDADAIPQLGSMSCQASASFGVALPLC